MKDNGLMLFIELLLLLLLAADPNPCIPPIINGLFVLILLLLVAILLDREASAKRSLRFIGILIAVTVTRWGNDDDDDIVVLVFTLLPAVVELELGVAAEC